MRFSSQSVTSVTVSIGPRKVAQRKDRYRPFCTLVVTEHEKRKGYMLHENVSVRLVFVRMMSSRVGELFVSVDLLPFLCERFLLNK